MKPKDFWAKVINRELDKNMELKTLAKRLKKTINQVKSDENIHQNSSAF
jgi:hypothetical protein